VVQGGHRTWATSATRAFTAARRQDRSSHAGPLAGAELVVSGLIRPEDVKDHPERNRIHNCIGAFVTPKVEIARKAALHPGDAMLLCSDGLWGALSTRTSSSSRLTVMRAVPELMDKAMAASGPEPDNCTPSP